MFKNYDMLFNPWRVWATKSRPEQENLNIVTHYEKGKYDLCILHLDQQSIYNPDEGMRISKGRLYSEVNECIKDIPKVVINHMTPFHDRMDSPRVVQYIKDLVGDNFMVVNSNEASTQWGWGHTIVHGLDPDEWWDLPKEPRCVVALVRLEWRRLTEEYF